MQASEASIGIRKGPFHSIKSKSLFVCFGVCFFFVCVCTCAHVGGSASAGDEVLNYEAFRYGSIALCGAP